MRWEFSFLGANIDAAITLNKFGIDKNRPANYHADSEGHVLHYKTQHNAANQVRNSSSVKE